MTQFTEGKLLRIFVGEADMAGSTPIYHQLLHMARENGLTGATVLRGIESYGHGGHTHTAKLLRLAQDLPIVVEIVDKPDVIDSFCEKIDSLFNETKCGGLITSENILLKRYISG